MTAGPRLVLVRHAETEWVERGLLHGRLDSPLSAAGRQQAERTALRLRGERFDGLYTSPQGRAIETAAVIGRAIGLEPIPLDGLREMDFGWLEGRPLGLLNSRALRPVAVLLMMLSAEKPAAIRRRITEALETMTERHPQGCVLAVTHWGTLSHIAAMLTDGDPRLWRRGPWAACGISEFRAQGDGASADGCPGSWEAIRLNDDAHLGDEDRRE
jgi:broad specificity phosphatase PhoE